MSNRFDSDLTQKLPVSAVICNRNRAQLLERCLASVIRNNPAEIIVVDGRSTDSSEAIARQHGTTVLTDNGRGLGYARRLGVQTASQPYIFFVDTDVVLPTADILATMVAELRDTGVAGLHAQILGTEAFNYWEWAQDAHFQLTFNHPGPRNAIGCVAALFRRDVLLAHAPDPYFQGASEDGDLSRRLRKAGHQLAVSHCSVFHSHRADFGAFVHQRFWYGRGNGRLAWRHRSPWLLAAPLAFLAGGTILALRQRALRLLPYLAVHAVCVSAGGIVEYADLFRRSTLARWRRHSGKGRRNALARCALEGVALTGRRVKQESSFPSGEPTPSSGASTP